MLVWYHGPLPVDYIGLVSQICLEKDRRVYSVVDRCLAFMPMLQMFREHLRWVVGSCTIRSSFTDKYYPGLAATARCSWWDSWTGESWWGWLPGEAESASLTETQRCFGTKGNIKSINIFITESHLFALLGLGLQRWRV